MSDHRFILETYSGMKTRYHCPACNHKDKTFVRYIDTTTNQHVHTSVGKCNRESNCQYHYSPKQYFQDNNIPIGKQLQNNFIKPEIIKPTNTISYIPPSIFKASLKSQVKNNFKAFLINKFGEVTAAVLEGMYFIGTSKHWIGATVFWQIDLNGKIRTGKIMLYDNENGKRIKEPFSHITWAHKMLNLNDYQLKQCFFGEHLLIDRSMPVAIVESEKTALVAKAYLPQFIWLAVGGINNLSAERCQILKGRKVILFPDLNAYDKWCRKADELSHIVNFQVSDLMERNAPEAVRKQGLDLADYLLKKNYSDFINTGQHQKSETPITYLSNQQVVSPVKTIEPEFDFKYNSIFPPGKREQYLADLEEFFKRDYAKLSNRIRSLGNN